MCESSRSRSAHRKVWALLGTTLLGLVGCLHQQARLQMDDEGEHDKARTIKTIGDVTSVSNAEAISVSGVGLVVHLEGTGGHPLANGYRTMLENYLKKKNVEHIKELLESPNTSLVLVTAMIPPGARKDDPLDVEVVVPAQSKTTSLKGGYLQECLLYNYDTAKHLDKNFKGQDRTFQGHALASAEGHLQVGLGRGEESLRLKQGRIWGGGTSKIDRPFFLLLGKDQQRAAIAQLVADRINESMQGPYHGSLTELATAKSKQLIVVNVPEQYRLNLPRFLRVVRLIPLQNSHGPNSPYRQQLEADLLDPKRTVTTAMRLEALGSESVPVFKTGLKSEHALVRFCSAESLAYLGDPGCGEVLAQMVRDQPALRAFSLTAMASLDETVCRVRLSELLNSPSNEARYGAFRALRALDERESSVQGEHYNDSFWLHRVAPQSPPLVHVAHSRRAEVVLFGEDVYLKPPFSFLAGDFTITANRDDDHCTITRLSLYHGTSRKQCSLKLEDALHTLAELKATYPNVDEFLIQADSCQCLSAPLAIDALPQAVSIYALAKNGADDPDFLNSDKGEIQNARLDLGSIPTLFDTSSGRHPTATRNDGDDAAFSTEKARRLESLTSKVSENCHDVVLPRRGAE